MILSQTFHKLSFITSSYFTPLCALTTFLFPSSSGSLLIPLPTPSRGLDYAQACFLCMWTEVMNLNNVKNWTLDTSLDL